jgi:hypothetical protein
VMSKERFFAKICHEEGVIFEAEYKTLAEAEAFNVGFYQACEALDIDPSDQDLFACVDDQPAEDEP